MSKTYTKTDLIKELAATGNISKRRMEQVLETLTQIAYREAHKGFVIPGLCRMDVVHRKARLVRNPQTNQTLQIAEHDALRVRPLKRAKDAIAPTPHALIKIVEGPATTAPAVTAPVAPAPAAATPVAPAALDATPIATPAVEATPVAKPAAPMPAPKPYTTVSAPKPYTTVPPPAARPKPAAPAEEAAVPALATDDGQYISFRCKNCGQEIEAPLDMVGAPNECPNCGENLIVPYISEEGTIWHQARATTPEKLPPSPSAIAAMKGRTIRIELPDDL